MTEGSLIWVVWPLTTPQRAPSSILSSLHFSISPFVPVLLLLVGAFEGLKDPVSLSFFLTKLGFLVGNEITSGRGCFVDSGFGVSFHFEIFSSTPLWG